MNRIPGLGCGIPRIAAPVSGLAGMPIQIHMRERIVPHIRIQIQALRIGEDGIGNRVGLCAPVGGGEAAQRRRVVAGQEVIVAGFGITFLLRDQW